LKKLIKNQLFAIIAVLMVTISACGDDDLKKANTISSKKITLTTDRSLDVEIIYSDSAKVKAKGFAPILDKVTPSVGNVYSEMPKGVNIIFYDEFLRQKGSIKSDYAINKETEKITIFRKNVVVVSDNMTFTTEELTWDENKKMYTSPYGTVTGKDGTILTGSSFTAPHDFSTYEINTASGQTYFDGKLTQ
jgi:hypothetical protein